jgi:hypothetical protein
LIVTLGRGAFNPILNTCRSQGVVGFLVLTLTLIHSGRDLMLRPKCKISPTNKDLAIKIFVSSMIFTAHNISLRVHGSEIKTLIMQLCFDKDIILPLPFLCSPPDHCRFCLFEGPSVPYPYKTFLTSHLLSKVNPLDCVALPNYRIHAQLPPYLAHVLSLARPLSLGFTLH